MVTELKVQEIYPTPLWLVDLDRETRTQFNGNNVSVPIKEGRLILFPTWLHHEVPVNRAEHERVSISFDIIFTKFAETISPTLWRKAPHPFTKTK